MENIFCSKLSVFYVPYLNLQQVKHAGSYFSLLTPSKGLVIPHRVAVKMERNNIHEILRTVTGIQ
jgi:hypothetical protein